MYFFDSPCISHLQNLTVSMRVSIDIYRWLANMVGNRYIPWILVGWKNHKPQEYRTVYHLHIMYCVCGKDQYINCTFSQKSDVVKQYGNRQLRIHLIITQLNLYFQLIWVLKYSLCRIINLSQYKTTLDSRIRDGETVDMEGVSLLQGDSAILGMYH